MIQPPVEATRSGARDTISFTHRRTAVVAFLLATAVGLLLFWYRYLDRVSHGVHVSPLVPLSEELTAAYGAAVLLMAIALPIGRRWSLVRPAQVPIALAASVGGAICYSVAHTSFNWLARSVVFALAGRAYDYGRMPTRYLMEFPLDVVVFAIFVAGVCIVEQYLRSRQREVDGARMKAQLHEAELRHLRQKLEPHFLFNALNTISSAMYEDPAAADEMIGHLSALLRSSLASSEVQCVPLGHELESLGHYVALLEARFGDQLCIEIDAPVRALDVPVPPVLLQPLVENAVRHGGTAPHRHVRIAIRARVNADRLFLEVEDDGAGIAATRDPFVGGVGLSAMRERLRLLYGDSATITAENRREGGFIVRLMLPVRDAFIASH